MNDQQLATNYIRACWIIKIRLISCRLTLWGESFSHIQFESCLLQVRKIVEGYAQLNLLLSHIEHEDVPKRFGDFYEVPKIIRGLRKADKKLPIKRASLQLVSENPPPRRWHLSLSDVTDEDEERIIKIWNRSGQFLHEMSGFQDWPYPADEAAKVLAQNLNSLRSDHQWLWNLLWSHYARFSKTDVFFVRLGSDYTKTRPILTKEEGHFDLAEVEFDPDYLADFGDEIDWSKHQGAKTGPPKIQER